jgi:hypothetical protein
MMKAKQRIFSDGNELGFMWGRFREFFQMEGFFLQAAHNSRWGFFFLAWILVAALMFFASCENRDRVKLEDAQTLNLMDRFSSADSALQDSHLRQNQYVTRKGLRKKSLVMIAPVCIHASLRGVSGKATLRGWAAPVFNIGDGLQMNLFLRSSGIRHQIGSRYFDAGRKAEDRDWIFLKVPLEMGEDNWLEIEISAGPQGNLVADWLALSELSLVKSKSL